MSQTDALLDLLRERGPMGVTPLEALDAIGSFRLAARVYDLRAEGYDIERKATVTAGTHKVIACYVLHEAAQLSFFDSQRDALTQSAPISGVARPADGRRAVTAGSRPG